MEIKLNADWKSFLEEEFEQPYFQEIKDFIDQEQRSGKVLFPQIKDIFSAFNHCPLADLKVVILGQDPYHNDGQAQGLAFSVPKGFKLPPSLKNIYKELYQDLNIEPSSTGDLSTWAEQGVLLLNTVLTVEKNKPNSHKNSGWQEFTDAVLQKISHQKEGIIFVLWGNEAIKKEKLLDAQKHFVLKSTHPSPFSAHAGFFGSKPFSKINGYLAAQGKVPINWEIKD